MHTWTGVASGTGSCTIVITLGPSTDIGVVIAELSGQGASPVDSVGTCVNSSYGTSCTVTASTATTLANDYALAFWFQQCGTTPSATGWTLSQNTTLDGLFTKGVPTLGTIVSNAGGSYNSCAWILVQLVVIKP